MKDTGSQTDNQQHTELSAADAELIIKNMEDTLYRVDTQGRLIYASPAAEQLTGYTLDELLGNKVTDLYMHQEKRDELLQQLSQSGGLLNNYEIELKHKQGQGVWVLINVRNTFDDNHNVSGIEGLIRNITRYKQAEQALNNEREKALVTLHSIADGVITTDINGRIEYINPMAETICGWSLESARGRDIEVVFNPSADEGDEDIEHPVHACLAQGKSITVPLIRMLVRRDDQEFAIRESVSPIRDSQDHVIGAVLVIHDITRIREMSRRLSYQASHDSHTGLINRGEFEKRLAQAIQQAQQQDMEHVLCYLDLDQFKIVNDTCGHIAGDALLKRLANTLHTLVRENDTFARLGGDEFGILIENCPLEQGIRVAENIRNTVNNFRFSWNNKMFEIGVSIGLVCVDNQSLGVAEVLSMADAACFIAKDQGRNRIHVSQMDDAAQNKQHEEMHWSYKIKHALEENQFTLHCQPIRCINESADELPQYTEILVRMQQQDKIISPMTFIPAAERYNLMQQIDRWVVKNFFAELRKCPGPGNKKQLFAINLSGTSINNNDFLNFVVSELENSNANPECICFEITETAAISNLEFAKRFMLILKGMGCYFALDDFGSGLSSFNYLKYLPVDFLKIDGSFVRELEHDVISQAMVESINKVGHIMGLKTIAEYAENQATIDKLKEMGVDYAQGFAISRPAPWDISAVNEHQDH
jgi:diguanylate cyclase (GGDEF)-like protein/PAS domain S-box-containing protein